VHETVLTGRTERVFPFVCLSILYKLQSRTLRHKKKQKLVWTRFLGKE